ncbi:MAG: Crp/Fnr family transcriptional regulator [Pyrinomonadaceae bacterium]
MSGTTSTSHISSSNNFPRNNILSALPEDESARMRRHLDYVEFRRGEVIYEPNEPIRHVYFPFRSTISLVAVMEDGTEVEVGVCGGEGMVGLPLVLGTDIAPLRALVQIPDGGMKMRADAFVEELAQCPELRRHLLRYAQAFFIQAAQTAACNRLHPLEGRLARWLLVCHDRTRSDNLPLTHEFMATMLGSRRAGVTEAARKLKMGRLIDYSRGNVRILDREGLERFTCECYATVKREFDRLLG